MIAEIDIYGVYFSSLLIFAIAAYFVHGVTSRILERGGGYRLVWYRPLFDSALYIVVLGCVVAAAYPLWRFIDGMALMGAQP